LKLQEKLTALQPSLVVLSELSAAVAKTPAPSDLARGFRRLRELQVSCHESMVKYYFDLEFQCFSKAPVEELAAASFNRLCSMGDGSRTEAIIDLDSFAAESQASFCILIVAFNQPSGFSFFFLLRILSQYGVFFRQSCACELCVPDFS
jgi:hypothetical protein